MTSNLMLEGIHVEKLGRLGFRAFYNLVRVGIADSVLLPYQNAFLLKLYQFNVDQDFRGRGIGRSLLFSVNGLIIDHGWCGLLQNRIGLNSPAFGIYERHGWQIIPGANPWLGFNLKTFSVDFIRGFLNEEGLLEDGK